jgi:hypothetical protein
MAERLYDAVLDRDASQRAAFLDGACRGRVATAGSRIAARAGAQRREPSGSTRLEAAAKVMVEDRSRGAITSSTIAITALRAMRRILSNDRGT